MHCSLRVFLVAGLAASSSALAQTWDGGGADNNFNTINNWNPNAAPVNNGTAAIIFAGAVRPTPVLNVPFSIGTLTFAAGASSFNFSASGGSTLTLQNGLTHATASTTHTISVPIVVANSQTWSTVAQMTVSGAVTLNDNVILNTQTASSGGTLSISGVWTGAGSITKTGPGRIFLSNDFQNSGGLTLSAGELFLQASNVLSDSGLFNVTGGTLQMNTFSDTVQDLAGTSTGTINIQGSGNLTCIQANDRTLASHVTSTATGSFTKAGVAELIVSDFNSFLGTINVNQGILSTSGNEVIGNTADVNISNNSQFEVNGIETVDLVTIGANGGGITGTGSLAMTSLSVTSDAATLLDIPTSGLTLNKTGTGTLTLQAPTNFTSTTTISNGRIIGGTEVLADGGILTVNSNGRFEFSGTETVSSLNGLGIVEMQSTPSQFICTAGSFQGLMSGSGKFIKTGGGTLSCTGLIVCAQGVDVQSGTFNANVSPLFSDAINVKVSGGTLNLIGPDTINQMNLTSGVIAGAGPLTFNAEGLLSSGTVSASLACPASTLFDYEKNTTGTVVLSGNNSGVMRGIQINQGVLEVSGDNNIGAPGVAPDLRGGTLRMTMPMTLNRPLTCNSSGGTLDCLASVTVLGLPTFAGPILKTGPGTLTFAGGAPGSGSMTIANGEVKFGADASIGLSSLAINAAGICTLNGGFCSAPVTNAGSLTLSNDARITGAVTNSGILEGDGRIQGTLTNQAAGEVWINSGDRLWIMNTSASTNAGTIDVQGGELVVDGPFTNQASTGFIYCDDAVLHFRNGLTNNGSMLVSLGEKSVFGDITNNVGGMIVVSGGRSATFVDDVINNGLIRTSAGGTSVFSGAVSGAGTFPGTGTVYFEGDLRPGNSPANVTFGGAVVLSGTCVTQLEVGGLNAGTQHDKMTVAGQASLDGQLNVTLINGFVPTAGNVFTIVQAGSIIGEFATVTKPRGMRVSYEPNRVRLIYCPADFNEDSSVDFFDYLDFVDAFSANLDAADFNGDSSIDFFDYLDFVDAFSGGC